MRIYLDLETTGLDPESNEIAQIAAATDSGHEFECKVMFDRRKASEDALAMGWYDADVWTREAVTLDEAIRTFGDWLRSIEPNRWNRKLIGHFAAEFDKPFLLAACKQVGYKFPADYRVQDSMQLALWLLPGRRSYKLPDLYRDLCGGTIDKREGAPGDVRATRAIVQQMKRRASEQHYVEQRGGQVDPPDPPEERHDLNEV